MQLATPAPAAIIPPLPAGQPERKQPKIVLHFQTHALVIPLVCAAMLPLFIRAVIALFLR